MRRRDTVLVGLGVVAALAMTAAPALAHGGGNGGGGGGSIYADDANWLCRPDLDDVCDDDLDATVVTEDGETYPAPFTADPDAPVDCFYVYPTVSVDPTPNSDLVAGELEEESVVRVQAARFGSECRVFAPLYRQRTLTALTGAVDAGAQDPAEVAYADVEAAWDHYLRNFNHGRDVVLMGHSQGASLLRRLIDERVEESRHELRRMQSAILLGSAVAVPEGGVVGGSFDRVPLCEDSTQTGCVISFASYRDTVPPTPGESRFGIVAEPGQRAACTNPAALGTGLPAIGDSLWATNRTTTTERRLGLSNDTPWVEDGTAIGTPFVITPGLAQVQCVTAGDYTYLEVSSLGDEQDVRAADFTGDLPPEAGQGNAYGLHLIDANVVQNDLIDLVREQALARAAGR